MHQRLSARVLLLLAALMLLCACGSKGPLSLPPDPPPAAPAD